MNMFCCQDTTANRRAYPLAIYNEFSYSDPITKQLFKQIVPFQENRNYQKYKNWKRQKVLSRNYVQLFKQLKQNQTNFIDLQFPHTNQAIIVEQDETKIKWARVGDIVKEAVYSRQHNIKNLQKFSSNNKQLQRALILIARAHPQKFKEILAKTLNQQGIYQFRLYRDGIIENVVIDDFVPVFNKIPMFTGPVKDKQVYPMLLEKAIAKLFGCYQRIPQDCETLMQTIFCGAVRKKDFASLETKEQIINILDQGIRKKGLIVLLSKFDSKVRNYGIYQNQLYQIIAGHQIQFKDSKVKLYECLTESRLNAWNGKYSANDQIWRTIDPQVKSNIFNEMKKNKSFCICEQDVSRIFQELMIFEDTSTANKDWIESNSQSDVPSFTKFTLLQQDRVFIRVIGPHRLRQSLILARIHQQNEIQYIGGAVELNQKSVQFSKLLEAGDYVICSLQQWLLEKAGEYRVFLSSNTYTVISTMANFQIPNFFENMFFNHSIYNDQQSNKNHRIYSFCLLIYEIGLAYLHIRTQNSKKNSLKVFIDEKKLMQQNWTVLQPYLGVKQIQITKINNKNSDRIIVLKANNFRLDKKIIFPSMAFKIQQ